MSFVILLVYIFQHTLSSDFIFFVGIFDNAFLAALHNRLCKENKTLLSVKFKLDIYLYQLTR